MAETKYTQKVAEQLCAYISEGHSLRTLCSFEGMPCTSTVYNWIYTIPEFKAQYAMAKEDQADAMAEDIMDIADNITGDVNRDRLRVESRKWLASKFKAKKYGDSTQVKHADADGNKIEEVNVNFIASKHTDT